MYYQRVSDDVLYQDGMWKIVHESAQLPNGKVATKDRVYRCDAVHILAFKDPDTILLLREYRPFWKQWVWMIPSGKIDKETDTLEAAQRELREETGYRADKLEPWFTTTTNEMVDFKNHVFIGQDLVVDPLEQDDTELIEVHEVPLKDAIDKVLLKESMHTVTGYVLLRYAYEKRLGDPRHKC